MGALEKFEKELRESFLRIPERDTPLEQLAGLRSGHNG